MGNHTDFHTWWFHFQAFAMVWLQGLTSSIMNQLIKNYELHDTVAMIETNQLKQKIRLPNMFEQIASLENQFKPTMMNSEKIAIVIDKLPSKYQGVLTLEMSKEGLSIMPRHIEDVTLRCWRAVLGSYVTNPVIDNKPEDKTDQK